MVPSTIGDGLEVEHVERVFCGLNQPLLRRRVKKARNGGCVEPRGGEERTSGEKSHELTA